MKKREYVSISLYAVNLTKIHRLTSQKFIEPKQKDKGSVGVCVRERERSVID